MDMTAALAPESEPARREYDLYKTWMEELSLAANREKAYRKEAAEVVTLYEGDKEQENQYNILYSNTETLAPALYNSTPRPQVRRRFKDNDPLGFVAARTVQRLLEYQVDNGSLDYPTFDDLMKVSVLGALVPGRGVVRYRYHAEFEAVKNEQEAEAAEAAGLADPGEESEPKEHEGKEVVSYETICGEAVPWDRFRHGYALHWRDVPWISYEYEMTKVELERNFGQMGVLVEVGDAVEDADHDPQSGKPQKVKGVKTAQVFEIWDKVTKKVIFISPGLPDRILKEVDDPLKLQGFFDCPEPLRFTQRVKGLTPTPLYKYYKEQARELNRVTARIQKIISALKVRGMYDSQVEGIEKALELDDNQLIPASGLAALQGTGQAALEKALWLFPLDKLVAVLQQLYLQRTQIKQVIFEITGIADIMRGSTQASETLGAQEIKNQWGTLRLKRAQKEVARFARDSLRIIAEIAVNKFAAETVSKMTGLGYPTLEQKQQAQVQLQMLQQQAVQAQALGDQSAMPPPPPPELLQAAQSPAWEEILALLQNDLERSYRIDIETNSTVDIEATEDKKDIAELLNAMSQFFSGVAPMMQSGALPWDVVKSMLLAVLRRFRFGDELEEQIKGMQAPAPQQSPELQKQAQKLQEEARQLEQERQQFALDVQKEKGALDLERKQFDMEKQFAAKELQMEAKYATRELETTAKQHLENFEMQRASVEEQLSQKEAAVKDTEARAAADIDGKKREVEQGGSQLVQAQQAIAKLLEDLQKFAGEIAKQGSQPRPTKAVKTGEGKWELQ